MNIKIIEPIKPPLTRAINTKLSRLVGDLDYVFKINDDIFRLRLKDGYPFDGASIPRFLWSLVGLTPHGIMDGPALPHDRIYQDRGHFEPGEWQVWRNGWVDCDTPISRRLGDAILEAYCQHFHVGNQAQIKVVWLGVRVGGLLPWLRDDITRKARLAEI